LYFFVSSCTVALLCDIQYVFNMLFNPISSRVLFFDFQLRQTCDRGFIPSSTQQRDIYIFRTVSVA
jgi:hypothetical protein